MDVLGNIAKSACLTQCSVKTFSWQHQLKSEIWVDRNESSKSIAGPAAVLLANKEHVTVLE